jgi:hypothetical protein
MKIYSCAITFLFLSNIFFFKNEFFLRRVGVSKIQEEGVETKLSKKWVLIYEENCQECEPDTSTNNAYIIFKPDFFCSGNLIDKKNKDFGSWSVTQNKLIIKIESLKDISIVYNIYFDKFNNMILSTEGTLGLGYIDRKFKPFKK